MNMRTLTIASAASAAAAAVTSQLWIAGTWIAAALTPVLVALISEAMHRPTERIARAWTSERGEARVARAQTPTRDEPAALTGTEGPVRIYRQSGRRTGLMSGPPTLSRKRIAIGGVALTAAIAFVIAIAAITAGDLVTGGSIGKGSHRTTLFSGKKSEQRESTPEPASTQPNQTQEPDTRTDEPATTPTAPEEQPTDTSTAPAPAPAPTTTTPGEPPPDTPATP